MLMTSQSRRLGGVPGFGGVPARLGRPADVARDEWSPWRRWYKTRRWRRLRWATLVADGFTCRRCGRIEGDTRRLVADHVEPHRGNAALFWDPANLQTLCAACHSGPKQAAERARGDG